MANTVISIEHLSKAYRLGQLGTGTLSHDLNMWWAKVRGKPHPWQKIGEADYNNRIGETIWALNDISFIVEQGEVLGIIGRNGAGKSTLLKILSRVTAPTSGKAKVRGRIASLLEIGTGFHPDLTGRENTYLNGAILGMSRREIDGKLDAIVDFSGVEQFIDTPVKRYSSGMYLRLAFAVAAHLEPEILVVDEVLAVGDAGFQKKCLGKMGDVAAEGRTVLLVSHNMQSVSSLAQRCVWLERGRISGFGNTDQVINQYMEQVNTILPGEGWANLSEAPRDPFMAGRRAQFCWMRLLDSQNRQVGVFREGDPVIIELGFQVMEKVKELQFGCSVGTIDGSVWLFTIPSPEYAVSLEPGEYSVRINLNPNYLRNGDYTFALKLFAFGQRQDTIGDVLRMTVEPYLSPSDNQAYSQNWVAGYLRLDYEWSPIEGRGK